MRCNQGRRRVSLSNPYLPHPSLQPAHHVRAERYTVHCVELEPREARGRAGARPGAWVGEACEEM
jgi:hypothetical protein